MTDLDAPERFDDRTVTGALSKARPYLNYRSGYYGLYKRLNYINRLKFIINTPVYNDNSDDIDEKIANDSDFKANVERMMSFDVESFGVVCGIGRCLRCIPASCIIPVSVSLCYWTSIASVGMTALW